jgi:hypothetical protein
MNYEQIYNNIISGAKQRVLEGYTEKHHIVPRSLGGEDTEENLVNLTAREHFICHWLLVKFTQGDDRYKMLNALRLMRAENPNQQRYETKITARVYENLKEEYAQLQSKKFSGTGNGFYGKNHTEEAKQKIREANLGRIQPQNEKQKQIAAMTGRKRDPFSKEWIEKLSKAKQGENNFMYGKTHTEETRQKMREKATGRKQSADTIQKKADAIRGSKREKKLCPHCNQYVAVNGYARWHGNNCKMK